MIIINTKYEEATKQMIVKNYREGMRVSEIISHYGIPKSTVYSWIKHSVETSACKKESSICNFHTLKEQVEKQNAMIKILQKAYGAKERSLKEKLSLAETLYSEYSVHSICDALLISRGTFYNHIKRNKRNGAWYEKRKEYLRQRILEIYHNYNQIFGAEKIAAILSLCSLTARNDCEVIFRRQQS